MADENAQQSLRDRIRGKTLGNKEQFKTREVEVNGETVVVKQPSVGERLELFDDIRDSNGNLDHTRLLTWGVIRLVYVPGEYERVFDDADYDELIQHPTNSWVDTLGETVLEVLNVESTEGNG